MKSRVWMGSGAAAAFFFYAAMAHAQAGMEAGAITSHSAGLAKKPAETGSATTTSTTRTQGAVGGSKIVNGKPVATTLPERHARPLSGAPGAISGQVLEHGNGKPVKDVLVRLVSTEPQYVVETKLSRTDSTGSWSFTDVEPGRWSLAIDPDRLPETYGLSEAPRVVVVAKKDDLHAAPFSLYRTACVGGHVQWADGYVFSDAPVLVAPFHAGLPPARGRVNGVGDYEICSAPADSAMVWLVLRDGRRIGTPVKLAIGRAARVDFKPPAIEDMPGTQLFLSAKTAGGTKVPFARLLLVGRRIGVAAEPSVVYVQDATADREGEVMTHVPYGTYEILGWNPRQGEWGRVEQLVIARGAGESFEHEVILRGSSTAEEQAAWRQDLLARADDFQLRWVP